MPNRGTRKGVDFPIVGCRVAGCERAHEALGLCSMHYKRLRRTGDPLVARIPGERERWRAIHRARHEAERERAREAGTCIHGHRLDPASGNVYRRPDGTIRCRACHREEEARRRQRRDDDLARGYPGTFEAWAKTL